MSGGMDEPYGRQMTDEEMEARYIFRHIDPVRALQAVREARMLLRNGEAKYPGGEALAAIMNAGRILDRVFGE